MVRGSWVMSSGGFQFHKGTIKTLRAVDMTLNGAHFNSIKVRLKHVSRYGRRTGTNISIP